MFVVLCRPAVVTRVNFAGSAARCMTVHQAGGRFVRAGRRDLHADHDRRGGTCESGAGGASRSWRRVRTRSVGRIDTDLVRDVLAAARPADWLPDFAVDTTVWMRCDAECSPQRGFYCHPSRHSAGQPIVVGWCYSWLVGLSAGSDSWTAPLDTRRLLVGDNPNVVAAQQIRQVLLRLGPLPAAALFAFDGGYGPVQLTVELAGTGAQIVVRVRNDRKYFARPVPRAPGQKGASRRHGAG